MVRSCPSGALGFRYKNGAPENPPKINRIAVLENGPLAITGNVSCEGEKNVTRLTLCRCGLSKNKPYCDSSHVKGEFAATGEPKPQAPESIDGQGGAFSIQRFANGPLKIAENVEITTGTGSCIAKHDRVFLCRCGASENKPYCDGSHRATGFKDPHED